MRRTLISGLALALLTTPVATANDTAVPDGFEQFSAFNDESGMRIDYGTLSEILGGIVLNVPPMDRIPERGRAITTGTRLSSENISRYRYEGNRVIFHLLPEEYQIAITQYREELEAIPSQIEFGNLSSDEQLAYWLNLHNIAVIEQIMQVYPVSDVERIRVGENRERLHDAKILTVAGVPLSLNDIRLRIVYEQWDQPEVMYGFFSGAIGGPEIRNTAYSGETVWRQLNSNAREFINSLRGVDTHPRELRVSTLYEEGADFFPNFDADLRAHLLEYARGATISEIDERRRVRPIVEEWGIADMVNGSLRCRGAAGPSPMTVSNADPFNDRQPSVSGSPACGVLPSNGVMLMNAVVERRIELFRQGRYGEVYTIDIPTEDPDSPDYTAEIPEEDSNGSVLLRRGSGGQ